jgi:hypothetical protein
VTARKRYGLTVTQFCRAYDLPQGEFYRLLATCKGPRIMRSGGKVQISPEAVEDWRKTLESVGSIAGA